MSIYSVFAWLAAFTIALSFVTAILGILSAGNRMVVRMLFFALPASALFRLLSRPLTEQSPYLISSYVAVVCVWLLPGAKHVGRRLSRPSTSPDDVAQNI